MAYVNSNMYFFYLDFKFLLKAFEDIFTKWPPWWSRDKVTMETSSQYVLINDVNILSKFGRHTSNSTEDIAKSLFWPQSQALTTLRSWLVAKPLLKLTLLVKFLSSLLLKLLLSLLRLLIILRYVPLYLLPFHCTWSQPVVFPRCVSFENCLFRPCLKRSLWSFHGTFVFYHLWKFILVFDAAYGFP